MIFEEVPPSLDATDGQQDDPQGHGPEQTMPYSVAVAYDHRSAARELQARQSGQSDPSAAPFLSDSTAGRVLMTDSDLELEPTGALALAKAPDTAALGGDALERRVEATPSDWSVAAAVGWLLFPDPSVITALCEPLSANLIDRKASLLRRSELLQALARRARGITTSTPPNPLRPEDDQEIAQARASVPEDEVLVAVFPSHRESREDHQRQRPEDQIITRIIAARAREVWDAIATGKLTAVGKDQKTQRRGPVPREEFSIRPTLQRFLEGRVGLYRDVTISRDQMLQHWRSLPAGGKSTKPAENKCRDWLKAIMAQRKPPERAKPAYRREAQQTLGVTGRAFDRAWGDAIADTGAADWGWGKAGAKPKNRCTESCH